uniref:Uncharacterized protein n=1 Tax=Oryza meridionalis TaxID=40149 RepID=A0A0E0EJF1_9ORYZ
MTSPSSNTTSQLSAPLKPRQPTPATSSANYSRTPSPAITASVGLLHLQIPSPLPDPGTRRPKAGRPSSSSGLHPHAASICRRHFSPPPPRRHHPHLSETARSRRLDLAAPSVSGLQLLPLPPCCRTCCRKPHSAAGPRRPTSSSSSLKKFAYGLPQPPPNVDSPSCAEPAPPLLGQLPRLRRPCPPSRGSAALVAARRGMGRENGSGG